MAQMRTAAFAGDFGATHPQAIVGFGGHVFFGYGRPEARPSSAGIKFSIGVKEWFSAAGTAVLTFFMVVPVLPSERALSAFGAADLKLL